MPFSFFLEDLVRGTSINKDYYEFKKVAALSQHEILELQTTKLKKLINHAYSNIPWYNSEMRRLGVKPSDVQTRVDIGLLPLLTRDIIREHNEALVWKEYKGKTFKGSSSGTTGIPITYFHDINGFSAGVAAGYNLMEFSGWAPGMKVAHLWGNKESIKEWSTIGSKLKQTINSKKNIPSTLLNNPDCLESVVASILEFKPVLIEGYPNSIFEVSEYLLKNKLEIPSVRFVITTAENLGFMQKESIEKALAPVTDLYGCGEVNSIACKPAGDAKYYIPDHHVVVEAVPDSPQEMKEVVVTDLDNYYLPFIRYKVGDMIDGVWEGSENNKYAFSYFKQILGRSSDCIVLRNGKKFFPINIFGGTLFRKYPSITRHKTVWNGKKLEFIFEAQYFNEMTSLENDIRNSLSGYDVDFEITLTGKLLPGKNGKHSFFEVK